MEESCHLLALSLQLGSGKSIENSISYACLIDSVRRKDWGRIPVCHPEGSEA
jgi:hypothetical protein